MPDFRTRADFDPKNNPSEVIINNVTLPADTIIILNGEKVIAESKILDGVAVFERVSRKPFEINFEFTIRQQNFEISTLLNHPDKYIFPQDKIEYYMQNVFLPDSVATLKNTFLNGLGITEIILKPITLTTIRGSTNVLGSLKAFENFTNKNSLTLVIPL